MLCLSRKEGESIIITTPNGTEFSITVGTIQREKVCIMFNAPIEVTIDREEVYDAKRI